MELFDLLNVLGPVTAQWYAFGIQLGVGPERLSMIELKEYLRRTLQFWLEKYPSPNVQDLVDALKSPVLSNHRLAAELERKYKGNYMCHQRQLHLLLRFKGFVQSVSCACNTVWLVIF